MSSYFGESAFGQAVAIYYHAKELAAKGDKEAQKAVDELGAFVRGGSEGKDEGK